MPTDEATAAAPATDNKQNGIKRPAGGSVTGALWDIADRISQSNERPATRKEVIDAYMAEQPNANKATANTQYARWVTYWGVSDTLKTNRSGVIEARKAEKAQAVADRKAERDAAKATKEQERAQKKADAQAAKAAAEAQAAAAAPAPAAKAPVSKGGKKAKAA